MSKIYASGLEGRLSTVLDSADGDGNFESFIEAFLRFAVPFGVFCALILLGFAAFTMITSAGNPEKLKDAREVATNAIIGALMIGLGVLVLKLVVDQLALPT